jgi:hypothetical protein
MEASFSFYVWAQQMKIMSMHTQPGFQYQSLLHETKHQHGVKFYTFQISFTIQRQTQESMKCFIPELGHKMNILRILKHVSILAARPDCKRQRLKELQKESWKKGGSAVGIIWHRAKFVRS